MGDERERRIEALRALAEQRSGEGKPPMPAGEPAQTQGAARSRAADGRRGLWLGLAATVVVAGVIAGAIVVWPRHATPPSRPIPDPLTLSLSVMLNCPFSLPVAWSPDGTRVALVGYSNCSPPAEGSASPPATGGTLVVYDATTGHQLASIALDAFVASATAPEPLRGNASAMSQVLVTYDDLIWSPDGRQLAMSYDASHSNTNGSTVDWSGFGALLVQWRTSHEMRVLPAPAQTSQVQSPLTSFKPSPVMRWDLSAGTGTLEYLPQAQSYAWTPDGTLAPAVPLPVSPDATPQPASGGPVGNPDGGASFTMWQSGYVEYAQSCTTPPPESTEPPTCCPVSAFYDVGYGADAAWSPDGRYLVQAFGNGLGAFGKTPQTLAPSATPVTAGCDDPKQAATLAPLPVRDRALAAVLKALPAPEMVNGELQGGGDTRVVWSADGKYLAASGGGPDNAVLSVYNCATGKLVGTVSTASFLAQIPLNKRDPNYANPSVDLFLWSPRGQRLLAVDTTDGVAMILGPKSLGL